MLGCGGFGLLSPRNASNNTSVSCLDRILRDRAHYITEIAVSLSSLSFSLSSLSLSLSLSLPGHLTHYLGVSYPVVTYCTLKTRVHGVERV
jgi:hypothetical protein